MKKLERTLKRAIFGSYVPVILINSAINAKATSVVRDCISQIDPSRADAIALLINSPGGSPVQCDIITQMVRGFSAKHNLPVYTFAEDIAASGGQFLLSIGDKSHVHELSLVGSVGVVGMWFGVGKFLREKQITPTVFNSNENQILSYMNVFENLTEAGKAKTLEQLHQHHALFIQHTETYSRLKIPKEERATKIFNAQIVLGTDAVKYGLADEIGDYQRILRRDFPKAAIQLLTDKTLKQKLIQRLLL